MEKIKRFKLWLPVIIWGGIIFWFSNQAINSQTAEFSWLDFVVKKTAHVSEYAIFFWLTFRANKSLKYSLLICLLFALSDEWHQTFVPGREGALRDVGFDTIGILLSLNQIRKNL